VVTSRWLGARAPGSWVGFVLAACCLALSLVSPRAHAVASTASHFTWQRRVVAELPHDLNRTMFVNERTLCSMTQTQIQLRCWDTRSGKLKFDYQPPAPAGDRPAGFGYALTNGALLLGYQMGNQLMLREVDFETGSERRVLTLDAIDGAKAFVRDFHLQGSRLALVYQRRKGKGWESHLRVFEAGTGHLQRDLMLNFAVNSWDMDEHVAYLTYSHLSRAAVEAYDLSSGKQVFQRSLGQVFVHGISAGPRSVFIGLEYQILKLDAQSGKTSAHAPIDRRGNPPPQVRGDRVYVCEGGLRIFDLDLKPLARLEQPNWVIGCSVGEHFAVLHTHMDAYAVDVRTAALAASVSVPEDYFVSEVGPFNGEGFPMLELIDASTAGSRLLSWLGKVPAEPFEPSGLPSGARLLEDGEPAPALASVGRHRFDLYRDGVRPAVIELDVVAGSAARPNLATLPNVPAPNVPEARSDTLPAGLELTDLVAFRGRSGTPLRYGSLGTFADLGRRIALDGRDGLTARTLRTDKDEWSVSAKELEAVAPPIDAHTPFTSAKLFALLPEARLALLATHGLAEGSFIAYDLDTGKLRWRAAASLLMPPGTGEAYFPAAVEYSGLVWYQSYNVLYGRDLRDGHLVYRYRFGDSEDLWGAPVFHAGRVHVIYKNELLALDLAQRALVWRAPISGRGFLTLGPNDAYLLFVDDGVARAISFDGKALARSPNLGPGLYNDPVLVESDAVYVCSPLARHFSALDPSTLQPRWTYRNARPQAPCPALFSAHQVAAIDGRKEVLILERKGGRVLLDEPEALPPARHVASDASGICLMERKGSVCFDR
jgi:PQQ-like domain